MFVTLPTGYGKSFCFGCLPVVFRQLLCKPAIVLVVSPLLALMADQVRTYNDKGVTAAIASSETKERVLRGDFELVYITPEQLLKDDDTAYRDMCQSTVFKERLVGLVVDEAHCVKKW